MRDVDDMRRAMRDARYLFHVAADYRLWARDREEIVRNNVSGTSAVMEAALDAGVERIVYTSSVATLKPGTREAPADETRRLTEAQAIGAYKRSKVAAERVVEQMIAENTLPAVIVNPSTPIGPRDIKPTPTGRIIVEAATGRMPAFLDTGLNLAHVEDVAAGHLLALERGKIGESYILGGQNVSLKEMLSIICEIAGRKAPRVQLPRRPLFPLAMMAEVAAHMATRARSGGGAGSRSARGAAGRPPISWPPALRRSMSSNLCSRMRTGGGNSSKRSAEPVGARRPFSFPKRAPRRSSVWAKRAPDGHSRSSTATTTGRLRSETRSLARLISKQPQWSSFMTWRRPMWRRACVR